MGLSAFIDMVGRDLINPFVLFAGLLAGVVDDNRLRVAFAVLASVFVEVIESQRAPALEWSYVFSWWSFAAQTAACIMVALALGRLLPWLNRFSAPRAR